MAYSKCGLTKTAARLVTNFNEMGNVKANFRKYRLNWSSVLFADPFDTVFLNNPFQENNNSGFSRKAKRRMFYPLSSARWHKGLLCTI